MTSITLRSDIPVELIGHMGGDHMVVAAAKVSTDAAKCMEFAYPSSAIDNAGLIKYLMKHRHGTPFEHGAMTFFVRAPIFVWREWHRHRIGFSYNEESGRYSKLLPEFYVPEPGTRPMMKVEGWKPGRPKFLMNDDLHLQSTLTMNLRKSYQLAYDNYESNLDLGIDPGLARDCLPVGIYSSCWVTCNPRSIMAFLSLRTSDSGKSYPLYEIEMAAKGCEKFFANLWPITYAAFNDNGRVGP